MGFKRTSEGRVFFQGAEGSANDEGPKPHVGQGFKPAAPRPTNGHMHDQQTQMQIVTLLKTLNERLKETQAERNVMRKELDAYRDVIGELENKAERGEKAYIELEQKLDRGSQTKSNRAEELASEALREMEETRKLLLEIEGKTEYVDSEISTLKTNVERHNQVGNQIIKKQNILEKAHQQNTSKISEHSAVAAKLVQRIKTGEERYEDLSDKVEKTGTEQSRIARKLDKAIEERARFMRKIERIEETVIQTRDSLNAKAMVLLTDQDIAGVPALENQSEVGAAVAQTLQKETPPSVSASAPATKKKPWWKAIYSGKTAIIVPLLLTGVIGGAVLGGIKIPYLPQLEFPDFKATDASHETVAITPQKLSAQSPSSRDVTLNAPREIADMDWTITPETSPEQKDINPASPAAAFNDDIGALDLNDEAQVKAALEGDTQKLALALNNIEPTDPPPVPSGKSLEQVALSAELSLTDKIQNPADVMKPDRALKDVIKKIEGQAFEGVAAAQHDLAAIYTAGHGGVKQNYKRARFWFEQAAARGVTNASYNLGVIHHQGLGGEPDMESALKWYAIAAKQGHPEAQYNLGIAYIEGIGVPYDPVKATGYFTNAAHNDITEAAYNLGLIYENGLAGNAKPDEALMWYKIAADQGSPEGKQALNQLAKSLNIDLAEVNRLAEGMKALKEADKPKTPPKVAPKAAPVKTISSAVKSPTYNVAAVTTPNAALSRQVLIAQVQEYLMGMGLYPGPADGVEGPLTADAVRSYQRRNALDIDGQASQVLLNHMMSTLGQGSRAQ